MAINPLAYTEKVVRSFLRYQLTSHPFADERLKARRPDAVCYFWTVVGVDLWGEGATFAILVSFLQGAGK